MARPGKLSKSSRKVTSKKSGSVRSNKQTTENLIIQDNELKKLRKLNGNKSSITDDISSLARFYKAIIDNSFDGIGIIDAKGNNVYQSPAVQRMLGYELEQRKGKSAFELMHPEDVPAARAFLKNLLKKPNNTGRVVARIKHKKGSWVYLATHGINFLHDPSVNGIVLNYRDITDIRKKDEQLRKFSGAMEHSMDGINITDMEGNLVYSNSAGEKIYGYKTGELKGKHVNIFNPDNQFSSKVVIPAIKKTGGWSGEVIQVKKDGTIFPIYLSTSIILNEKSKPIGMLGIVRDITESKKREQELTMFSEAVDQSLDGVCIVSLKGEIVKDNKALRKIFGYKSLVGQSVTIFHTNEGPTAQDIIDVTNSKGRWEGELNLLRRNKTIIPVFLTTTLVKIGRENIGILAIVTDITEQKKIEQRVLEARLEAEDEERKRVAMEIHDGLGQVLFGMQLFLEGLEKPVKSMDESAKSKFYQTKQALSEVFKEVRNISHNLMPQPLEESTLIPAVASLCQRLTETGAATIEFSPKAEKVHLSTKIQHTLYRIIQEILSNILRHSQATKVKVNITINKNETLLQVKDNGTGVKTSLKQGGIGLDNIKHRVNSLKGSLKINSIREKGTLVEIRIQRKKTKNRV